MVALNISSVISVLFCLMLFLIFVEGFKVNFMLIDSVNEVILLYIVCQFVCKVCYCDTFIERLVYVMEQCVW